MGHPRLPNEAIDRRDQTLYDRRLRSLVDTPANHGKQIVIDVETGEFEIDDGLAASLRMLDRRPDAAHARRVALHLACARLAVQLPDDLPAYLVQSWVAKPGTRAKSLILRVTRTMSREIAVEAIRRSMVAMRTRWATRLANTTAAAASNGIT
jgi:hypothetical protein